MARRKTIQKIEKSKTLLIEENRLSNTKEQRKALEKTFQGLEGFIAASKSKLKELEKKVVDSNGLLKLKEKEISLSNKKIVIAKNNFNGIENKISILDNDRKIKEANNEKDFLVSDKELKEVKSSIVKQNLDFNGLKKVFENEENEIKERIRQKISQSKQFDIDIEEKKSKVKKLEKIEKIKNDKIIVLDNSIKSKKEIIEDLKKKIDNLEKIENKKQDQVKKVKGELIEIEEEKAKKDKELETTKGKISLILKKEAVNNMKEKRLKEEYKKIGL